MLRMVWMVWWITPRPQWTGGHWTRTATWFLNAQVKGHSFWFGPLSPLASFSLHLLDLARKNPSHNLYLLQLTYLQQFSNRINWKLFSNTY